MPDEVTAEELAHPESLAVHQIPGPGDDGLWSPQRRPLTLGLVLTITLVAAEEAPEMRGVVHHNGTAVAPELLQGPLLREDHALPARGPRSRGVP